MMSLVGLNCPHCGSGNFGADVKVGQVVVCPHCDSSLVRQGAGIVILATAYVPEQVAQFCALQPPARTDHTARIAAARLLLDIAEATNPQNVMEWLGAIIHQHPDEGARRAASYVSRELPYASNILRGCLNYDRGFEQFQEVLASLFGISA